MIKPWYKLFGRWYLCNYLEDFVLGHRCHSFYSELACLPQRFKKKKKRNVNRSVVAIPFPEELPDPGSPGLWHCRQILYCLSHQFSSVQFSCSVMSDSLQPHESQHARPSCPSPTPRVYSNSCPSYRWCHLTISSSVVASPPAPNPSQHQGLFQWVNSSREVAKVLEFQLQHQSFQWTLRTDLL